MVKTRLTTIPEVVAHLRHLNGEMTWTIEHMKHPDNTPLSWSNRAELEAQRRLVNDLLAMLEN